ncbi:hypothetical protein M0J40_RS10255 [Providencia rettgeri]|nr:hypothetical protein [Providencia rettgeri]ELR5124551.1 hypothetical protein [Providencia rettgeri]ELR5245251.1 hypothetical protein [Providencia rettgeri]ELS4582742.1 hypothetical protein [Providencia rettgeri]
MKKYLLSIMLPLLMTSSLVSANNDTDAQYIKLKPIAEDIFKRSVALAESSYEGYQSFKYADDKTVWRKARDERKALSEDAKKLGKPLASPFQYCIALSIYSTELWGQAISEGKIDVSTFNSYLTAKKDCDHQLNNTPEDKSNLRAVDL